MFHCRVELYEGILSQLIAKAIQYEKSPTHLPYPKNITVHGAYVDIPAQSAAPRSHRLLRWRWRDRSPPATSAQMLRPGRRRQLPERRGKRWDLSCFQWDLPYRSLG